MRQRVEGELLEQRQMEGPTPDTDLLLAVLQVAHTAAQWGALAKIEYHRYGDLSYQAHRFYRPSNLLMDLKEFFEK